MSYLLEFIYIGIPTGSHDILEKAPGRLSLNAGKWGNRLDVPIGWIISHQVMLPTFDQVHGHLNLRIRQTAGLMWKHRNTYAIGGLENIGFDQADTLTVLSSQGVGLFNCLTGERIFRQVVSWWENYEPMAGTVSGYGILEGSTIRVCGLEAQDFMSKETRDGWIIECTGPVPDDPPFEKCQVSKIFLTHLNRGHHEFICQDGACELRAFGFSVTGNSLVVATSCNLIIWSRV